MNIIKQERMNQMKELQYKYMIKNPQGQVIGLARNMDEINEFKECGHITNKCIIEELHEEIYSLIPFIESHNK